LLFKHKCIVGEVNVAYILESYYVNLLGQSGDAYVV